MKSWVIQQDMDYLIDPEFIKTYISSGLFAKAKQNLPTPKSIMAIQFHHDNKVFYGAIKSATRLSMPNNQYLLANAKEHDGVTTWHQFLEDYDGKVLHQHTGSPNITWLYSCQYLADVHNVTADETLNWHTPWSN